ncbi:hypothetical protein GF357_04220 [Candidatus Dojkabacteria bacterium]|nr:hypothetical protein [Candidatus Dojkabacteria bacterium]
MSPVDKFKKLSSANKAIVIIVFVIIVIGIGTAGYFFTFNPDENLSQEESSAAELVNGVPGPCSYTPYGEKCHLGTRTITEIKGDRVESITAYGYVWNFNIDNSHMPLHAPVKLSSIGRYSQPYGPCYQDDNCDFDTRGTYENRDGERIEIITVGGRIWIYNITRDQEMIVAGKSLNNFPEFSQFGAPCYSSSVVANECEAFDTLDIRTEIWDSAQQIREGDGRKVQIVSITRGDAIWDYEIEKIDSWKSISDVFGEKISDLPRYRKACSDVTCSFDTRAYTETRNGEPLESTTYGEMIFNFPIHDFDAKVNYDIDYEDTQVVELINVERYF